MIYKKIVLKYMYPMIGKGGEKNRRSWAAARHGNIKKGKKAMYQNLHIIVPTETANKLLAMAAYENGMVLEPNGKPYINAAHIAALLVAVGLDEKDIIKKVTSKLKEFEHIKK